LAPVLSKALQLRRVIYESLSIHSRYVLAKDSNGLARPIPSVLLPLQTHVLVIRDIQNLPSLPKPVLTIGTFDGVHVGHQQLLRQVCSVAHDINGTPLLLTFSPHPRMVLQGKECDLKLIQTEEEKLEKLSGFGLHSTVLYPFTKAFSQWSSMEYISTLLVDTLKVHTVVIGYDHRFGANREGSLGFLKEMGQHFNYRVIEIPAEEIDAINISSTKIRKAIETGDIALANRYLGSPYSLRGVVVHGQQLGRTLDFPTANIRVVDPVKIIPSRGVYAGTVEVKGQMHKAMINIGYRPTLGEDSSLSIEVHLLDFAGDLYGSSLDVYFLCRVRDERAFPHLEALQTQLKQDEIFVRQLVVR
jgi:riboflavin kinase/FMN adenylyltransferase